MTINYVIFAWPEYKKVKNVEEYTKAVRTLTDYLDAKRLRRTPERFTILKTLWRMSNHADADLLYQEMQKQGYPVSMATVYNTLELLLKIGIVRKHIFGKHAIYELSLGNHLHLICTSCGKIKEVNDHEIMRMLSLRKFQSFSPSYYSTTVFGKCLACIRRQKKEERQAKTNNKNK